jgi:hypothetical protein
MNDQKLVIDATDIIERITESAVEYVGDDHISEILGEDSFNKIIKQITDICLHDADFITKTKDAISTAVVYEIENQNVDLSELSNTVVNDIAKRLLTERSFVNDVMAAARNQLKEEIASKVANTLTAEIEEALKLELRDIALTAVKEQLTHR